MSTPSSAESVLPIIPLFRPKRTRCISAMFRVVQEAVTLPADMPAALAEQLKGRLLPNGYVGMVTAESMSDLFWVLDEFVDPHSVELMPVASGGVCFYYPDMDMFPRVENGQGGEDPLSLSAATDALVVSGVSEVEFSGAEDMGMGIHLSAGCAAQDRADDVTWADVVDAYRQASIDGGWYKPRWPRLVYLRDRL